MVRVGERARVISVISVKKSIQWLVFHVERLFSLGMECLRSCMRDLVKNSVPLLCVCMYLIL